MRALPIALALALTSSLTQAQFVSIGTPSTQATSVSHDGQWVVGHDSSTYRTWRWNAATGLQTVPGLVQGGFANCTARIANGGGVIAGASVHGPAVWTPSSLTELPGFGGPVYKGQLRGLSADGSLAAGSAPHGGTLHHVAFRWDALQGQVAFAKQPDSYYSLAFAVSADGSFVVGSEYDTVNVVERFVRWDANGAVQNLSFGPTENARAYGVNHDGKVLVGVRNAAAVRWTAATGMQPLTTELNTAALGVSDDGETVIGARSIGAPSTFLPQTPQFHELASLWTACIWREGMGWRNFGEVLLALEVDLPVSAQDLYHVGAISGDGRVLCGTSVEGAFVVTLPEWVESYCTAQTNSQGCTPHVATSGTASASSGAGFHISTQGVIAGTNGILIYGTSGAASQPFNGGTLCVAAPRRTPAQSSGGSSACGGSFDLDFNAFVAGGSDLSLVTGAQVWAQYWSRDPHLPPPANTHLTDAVTFRLMP